MRRTVAERPCRVVSGRVSSWSISRSSRRKCSPALATILPETVRATARSCCAWSASGPTSPLDRFRSREAREFAEPIVVELASWAQDAVADLEPARPRMPSVLDDRAEESWEPLFAIAELAGGNWPERCLAGRPRTLRLARGRGRGTRPVAPPGHSGAVRLPRRRSLRVRRPRGELERAGGVALGGHSRERSWTFRSLAQRLRRYSIRPRTIRLEDGSTPKGYLLEQFRDAFSRYSASRSATATQPAWIQGLRRFPKRHMWRMRDRGNPHQ